MPVKVFIDGAEGTTGLRLAARMESRKDIELIRIDPVLRKEPRERAYLSNNADIVFLCLPDQAAREAVAAITNPYTRVIDASTAHRTLDHWAYGLPELSPQHRAVIAASNRVCVPGCHASGVLALLYPLVQQGIVPADYPFTIHSVTGYSGAGRAMIERYTDKDRPGSYGSPRHYALAMQHKHLPEIQKIAGLAYKPAFNPIIGDFYAGMLIGIPIHTRLLQHKRTPEQFHDFYEQYYDGKSAIRLLLHGAEAAFDDGMVDAGALAGLDYMELLVCGNEEQVMLLARLDNLGKGASGAAIQCMNIMCGMDEKTALNIP